MAESWGGAVSNWRGGCNAWVVSETDTTATIRVVARWQSLAWGFNVWNGNTAYVECDGQSSGWVSVGSVYSATGATVTSDMLSRDFTVAKSTDARNVWCYAEFHLGGYQIGNSGNGVTLTIGGINYSTPSTPTNQTVARVSDSSQRFSWGGNNTDSGSLSYWRTVTVRRSTDGAGEVQVYVPNPWSNSATNWTDNTTSAGHYYRYRCVPYNGNYNTSADFVGVYTTPTAPTSVTVTKTGTSSVSLAVATSTYSIDGMEVQQSTDGGSTWETASGSWTGTATSTSSRTLTFVPASVPAGTVQYRARLYKASGGSSSSTLYSSYTTSNSITTITPPLAPSVRWTGVVPNGGTERVTWTPNHPDGTSQTKAQVEVTDPSGTVTTYDVSGSTASYSFTVSVNGTWKLRVRTYGLYESYGEWSAYCAFTVATAPSATITSPSYDYETVEKLPIDVTWEITAADGVSSQSLTIRPASDSSSTGALTFQLSTSARSLSIDAETYLPDNGTGYVLSLTVASGSGLAVTTQRTFTTDYAEPSPATIGLEYDATALSAAITASFGATEWTIQNNLLVDPLDIVDEDGIEITMGATYDEGVVSFGTVTDTVKVSVVRVNPDGSQTYISQDMSDGERVIDPLPPLNTDYAYLVTSYSAEGTATTREVDARVDSGGMEAFNFGQAAETCVQLGLNAQSSASVSHSGQSYHFALGSDAPNLPTFYPDGDTDVTGTKSYVMHALAEYLALRDAVRDPSNAVCWYRDHWGHRAFVKADWTLGYASQSYSLWDASVSMTEVVWEEPVNG